MQVGGGVFQVIVGTGTVVVAITGEVSTGGLATLGTAVVAIGGLGQVLSGALNIAGGLTGNDSLGAGATAVSGATNPVSFVAAVATGNMKTSDLIGSIAGIFSASGELLQTAVNGGLGSLSVETANIVSAPVLSVASTALFLGSDALSETSPITIYTAPITVNSNAVDVPVAYSAIPEQLSGGGGSVHEAPSDGDLTSDDE